ncbi:MAG: DUF2085 domain-containing protein [Candidatus Thermoplasmatota archaeon]|jgi:uncharacterized membrane protein|nr:DUF2085 domain-containing protein [Candidatus Thermoplasmatota archaeon]
MEKREKFSSLIIFLFFIILLSWVILQFLGPVFVPNNTINDLSGLTGISDNDKIIEKIPFPFNLVYSLGDRLCHQNAQRSFFINGNQMPFCSRCTAIWLGLTIGLGFMIFYKIEFDKKFFILIIIGIFPIAVDGIGQLLHLWESTNIIRLITGLLAGIITGLAIGIIFDEIKEIRILKKQQLINKMK